ncbi:hypothetical protein VaNZ11_013150, partial [Volvox africanus]
PVAATRLPSEMLPRTPRPSLDESYVPIAGSSGDSGGGAAAGTNDQSGPMELMAGAEAGRTAGGGNGAAAVPTTDAAAACVWPEGMGLADAAAAEELAMAPVLLSGEAAVVPHHQPQLQPPYGDTE